MDLNFTPEEHAFREEIRTWVAANLPQDISHKVHHALRLSKDDLQRWARILGAKGWHGWAWPKEFGGPGWNAIQKHLFEEECALAGAPRVVPFGPVMVAPVIMAFGTPAQQQRFLPDIMSGKVWWSQGYSEPGSGSDLASVKCKAERKGDYYLVNGQKTWTTLGQYGDWIFCLVRTSTEGKPQTGISFLLIDMKSPGVSVRPIITMDGEHEVNEVWFDNVEVPVDQLIGEENKGWTYAKHLLAHERTNIADVNRAKRELERLKRIAIAEGDRARDDGAARALGREKRQVVARRGGPLEDPRQRDPAALQRAHDAGRRPGCGAFHQRGHGGRLARRHGRGRVRGTTHRHLLQHAQDDDLRRLERSAAQHRRANRSRLGMTTPGRLRHHPPRGAQAAWGGPAPA
jgi:alkylation response protein AidB-like acyl-CoA dehydrogenase